MKTLAEVFEKSAEALELIVRGETGEAMNRFN